MIHPIPCQRTNHLVCTYIDCYQIYNLKSFSDPNYFHFNFQLSRSWLNDKLTERRVSLQDLVLVLSLKFLPPEETLRRVPTGKSTGLFGTNISLTCR